VPGNSLVQRCRKISVNILLGMFNLATQFMINNSKIFKKFLNKYNFRGTFLTFSTWKKFIWPCINFLALTWEREPIRDILPLFSVIKKTWLMWPHIQPHIRNAPTWHTHFSKYCQSAVSKVHCLSKKNYAENTQGLILFCQWDRVRF